MVKVPVVDTLGVVVTASGFASNVGNTVTVITAEEHTIGEPLHKVYDVEDTPANPADGVNVYCPVAGSIVNVPVPADGVPEVNVPPIVSLSLAAALPVTGIFSIVLVASFTAVGQLFKLTVIDDEPIQPSELSPVTE